MQLMHLIGLGVPSAAPITVPDAPPDIQRGTRPHLTARSGWTLAAHARPCPGGSGGTGYRPHPQANRRQRCRKRASSATDTNSDALSRMLSSISPHIVMLHAFSPTCARRSPLQPSPGHGPTPGGKHGLRSAQRCKWALAAAGMRPTRRAVR
jgi:hypothetical protein